ncbi:MBL fold metallo-hydrolase [Asticcacaulis sp. 201]|uniref:MBL fold metallo-hydrolase n=1 Tax=Asticcacaulis sp. 201 TaxID=3028787 RepID=UPI0029165E79|nr:MBL fold metallo-hydrolase [Asticcacaulis sp. 201]MDV6329375.1 MBL fold metallo-hydrolase [Asticcacaulis sp. 201]
MSQTLIVKILGCGCSTGVPRIDGYWGACDPTNAKNRRSRCSAWFGLHDDATPDALTSVVVDTSPEFRSQMIAAGVESIDAVLWTHDHADQCHGIDDMRAYTFALGRPIDGYFDAATRETLETRFKYVFTGNLGYPPVCEPHLIPPHGQIWQIKGAGGAMPVVTFDQIHGPIRSVGYRIGDVAYSSDVSDVPEHSFDALKNLKVWIVDCLRYKPHPTHSHLEKTLRWIKRVKPERAILTNLHQDIDYDALARILPPGVEPAYDQLELKVSL